MRCLILGFHGRAGVVEEAARLQPLIEEHVDVVDSDFTGEKDMSTSEADIAIVFGGDGSILRAAHQMGERQLPIIAVNLGRLGFLADVAPDELHALLASLDGGSLPIVRHLMFRCRLLRRGKAVIDRIGLNEVTIQTGPPYAMIEVDLYVDSELVTTYSGDGVIISTPCGSTAHNLSAGGPILRKELQAFVISPISPHTLSVRPVVDSADRVYELVVNSPRHDTPIIMDGIVIGTVEPGDRLQVERAKPEFQLVMAPGHNYYRTLREKLGWSGRIMKRTGGAD